MQILFSLDDTEALKGILLHSLPHVKSSNRVEAMARGLGWNSNAALRAELSARTSERMVDDLAFTNYLSAHGFTGVPADALSEAVIHSKFAVERQAIVHAMTVVPNLTPMGFEVPSFDERFFEVIRRIEEGRREMLILKAMRQFFLAYEFMKRFGLQETINESRSSYWLKHDAEKFHRARQADAYVSNGILIAAAIHLGFRFLSKGRDAYFNLSATQKKEGVATKAQLVDFAESNFESPISTSSESIVQGVAK